MRNCTVDVYTVCGKEQMMGESADREQLGIEVFRRELGERELEQGGNRVTLKTQHFLTVTQNEIKKKDPKKKKTQKDINQSVT